MFKCEKIYTLLIFLSFSIADTPNIYINEFLASNASTNLDSDFYSYCDWIEIYNSEDTVINITGYYLTDDLSDPFKFLFPDNSIIQPNSYIIIWADGENLYPGDSHINEEYVNLITSITTLHTNFKLKKSGEEIGLFNPNGDLIDSIIYQEQITDISYGRKPDGSSEWFHFSEPTPLDSNISIGYQNTIRASIPQYSYIGGFYNNSLSIELTSEYESATIRFTLNGSKPNANSEVYISPIIIDSTTIIRAQVFETGILPSLIVTNTYFINDSPNLPVISIGIDSLLLWDEEIGIYLEGETNDLWTWNCYQDWERPSHIELYDQNGELRLNMNIGIKIHGTSSRSIPQKSFALIYRSKYGSDEINHRIFSDKEIDYYKSIILRNSGYDWRNTLFNDGLCHTLVAGQIDLDYQAYQPAVVFINGRYWGILNIREKLNEHYITSNHGVEPDNLDLIDISGNIRAVAGDTVNYYNLLEYVESQDLSMSENYDYIRSQMDVIEYYNYQISEIFFANFDWPGNNVKLWRPRLNEGKWRWIINDHDYAFNSTGWYGINHNTLEWATAVDGNYYHPPWSTSLFRNLLENNHFKNEFIQRFANNLNSTFHTEFILDIIDSLKTNIEMEIPRHINRWNDEIDYWGNNIGISSINDWNDNINIMIEFANQRPAYVRQHIIDYFGISGLAELTLNISDHDAGRIEIHDMNIPSFPNTGIYFQDIPVRLKAVPNEEYQFVNWQGISGEISNSDTISVILMGDSIITALFEHINFAPIMSEIQAQSMDEDQSFEMVVSGTDDNEADILTYGALSSVDDILATISNDTLSIGLSEDWYGTAEIIVYVTDGELSDTTSFTLTVNAVNDAPTVFDLISPEDSTQIIITSTDLIQELDLVVSWEPSTDIDNDSLSYGFVLYNDSNTSDVLINTFSSDTVLNITYQSIAELISFMGLTSISGNWTVFATDGVDTTQSGDFWNITLNASSVLSVEGDAMPAVFVLYQNYPNPFNPITTLSYDLPEDAMVSIKIYDMMGRVVKNLVSSSQGAGYRSVIWNATDDQGQSVSAGVYIYTIQAGSFISTKKMLLLK